MGILRSVSTSIWTDDTILSMSPEQKLILLYLHTNQFTNDSGVYKMHWKMMAFETGMSFGAFESAIRGLVSSFPNIISVDWNTDQVTLFKSFENID